MTACMHQFDMRRQRGFTLVEAIVVMVVTGILATTMVLFIRRPVQNYVDAVGRAELTDVADLALLRMTRELRGALSNSVRVLSVGNVVLLEFIPTKAGGRYLTAEDLANGSALTGTAVVIPGGTSFTVLGPMPVTPNDIQKDDSIVVFNLGTGMTHADAYVGDNRVRVSGAPVGQQVSTDPNTFNSDMQSSDHRFSVVRQPVTFRCAPNAQGQMDLTRYWNYGFVANQPDPANLAIRSSAILASNVASCNFSYTVLVNQPSALVGLSISQGRANSTETATLVQQVHMDNTP